MTKASGRPTLVLASGSPRRRELLAELGLEFLVRPVPADETPVHGETPEQLVRRLALAKARAAVRTDEVALGADTVVALDDEILGKPADDDEARRMLGRLSGREHDVWTGVAVVADERGTRSESSAVERSRVRFRHLERAEIDAYVASGEPHDKAGAYAVQGGASAFVDQLRGSWSNVVGLPWMATARLLGRALGDGRLEEIARRAERRAGENRGEALSRRP